MAPPERKARDICIWFVTCFFFLLILSGGISLVIYITLPETEEVGWLPIAGMVLISIPWIFWILTWMYRTVIFYYKPAPAEESELCSLGEERRVRFGEATVIETQVSGNRATVRNVGG